MAKFFLKFYSGGEYAQVDNGDIIGWLNPTTLPVNNLNEARVIADDFIMKNKADAGGDIRVDIFDSQYGAEPEEDYRIREWDGYECVDKWMRMGTRVPLYSYFNEW